MLVVTVFTYAAGFDLVGFLAAYAAVYAAGALALTMAVLYGPIRAAAAEPGEARR